MEPKNRETNFEKRNQNFLNIVSSSPWVTSYVDASPEAKSSESTTMKATSGNYSFVFELSGEHMFFLDFVTFNDCKIHHAIGFGRSQGEARYTALLNNLRDDFVAAGWLLGKDKYSECKWTNIRQAGLRSEVSVFAKAGHMACIEAKPGKPIRVFRINDTFLDEGKEKLCPPLFFPTETWNAQLDEIARYYI